MSVNYKTASKVMDLEDKKVKLIKEGKEYTGTLVDMGYGVFKVEDVLFHMKDAKLVRGNKITL